MSGIHEQCQEDFLKKQIEAWIQTDFGPRCDTFEETCIVCRKWKALDEMFDGLTTPAECDSDPWVTQDRVPARVGIDEYRYASFEGDQWWTVGLNAGFTQEHHHGWETPGGDTLLLRCRLSQLPELRDVPEQPAEDPDEWVIQDRVPVRADVDRCWWASDVQPVPADIDKMWVASLHFARQLKRHGDPYEHSADSFTKLHVMCRRRDLPKVEQVEQWPKYYRIKDTDIAYMIRLSPTKLKYVYKRGYESTEWEWSEDDEAEHRTEITEAEAMALLNKPEPQPQKTRVRLWIPREWNSRSAIVSTRIDDKQPNLWRELHHDAEGFYVEEQH